MLTHKKLISSLQRLTKSQNGDTMHLPISSLNTNWLSYRPVALAGNCNEMCTSPQSRRCITLWHINVRKLACPLYTLNDELAVRLASKFCAKKPVHWPWLHVDEYQTGCVSRVSDIYPLAAAAAADLFAMLELRLCLSLSILLFLWFILCMQSRGPKNVGSDV